MLKKRIIFTLLYDSGSFMLSRNFRLQRVGNLDWLQRHYNFAHVSFFIDELIVLDVTRGDHHLDEFCHTLEALTTGCFVPIAAGGGVRTLDQARALLRSGADKIVVNSPLFEQPELVQDLASSFGQQCVVGSVDLKRQTDGTYQIHTHSGRQPLTQPPQTALQWLKQDWVGELYLNSIDRDGTGQGYDFALLDQLPADCSVPVILAGGVGNGQQLAVGFADPRVDAVATAHLFNFLGDGLQRARQTLIDQGANLPVWPSLDQMVLKNTISSKQITA